MVNVASVIAFFAFASNVTGHVAVLAEELVKGHGHQLGAVAAWLLAFLGGAFVATLAALPSRRRHSTPGRTLAVVLEILLLAFVAFYGAHFYAETLVETEILVGVLLFAMGLQNGFVATISEGVVKTTHLTGLLTDLGIELSLAARGWLATDARLAFKLRLHLLIFGAYVTGGVLGGALYIAVSFRVFYVCALLLAGIYLRDYVALRTPTHAGGVPSRAYDDARVPARRP
jgi:uncharacterized membrane protein YoaK (UPF0700 family)